MLHYKQNKNNKNIYDHKAKRAKNKISKDNEICIMFLWWWPNTLSLSLSFISTPPQSPKRFKVVVMVTPQRGDTEVLALESFVPRSAEKLDTMTSLDDHVTYDITIPKLACSNYILFWNKNPSLNTK